MKYEIKIADSNQNTCLISLSLPLIKHRATPDNSTWEVKTEGVLKYRLGGCFAFCNGPKPKDDPWWSPVQHLYPGSIALAVEAEDGRGLLTLENFFDQCEVANSSGKGIVVYQMCLSFKNGALTWILL